MLPSRALWVPGIMETNGMSAEERVDAQLRQASMDVEGRAGLGKGSGGREGGAGRSRPAPGGLWLPELTASSSLSGEMTVTSLASVTPHLPPRDETKYIHCWEDRDWVLGLAQALGLGRAQEVLGVIISSAVVIIIIM